MADGCSDVQAGCAGSNAGPSRTSHKHKDWCLGWFVVSGWWGYDRFNAFLAFQRINAQELLEVKLMTSEQRNRRMKYGHAVPRWWIPDFNLTHRNANRASAHQSSGIGSSDRQILRDHHERKRRSRRMNHRHKVFTLHKDLRLLQNGVAILLMILGLLIGGPIGLAIGACVGLALLLLRLPSP